MYTSQLFLSLPPILSLHISADSLNVDRLAGRQVVLDFPPLLHVQQVFVAIALAARRPAAAQLLGPVPYGVIAGELLGTVHLQRKGVPEDHAHQAGQENYGREITEKVFSEDDRGDADRD